MVLVELRLTQYVDTSLTQALLGASRAYDQRFDSAFPLPAPFNTDEHRTFAHAMISNLLGGIGYYQGASIVDRSFRHDYDDDDVPDDDDEEESNHGMEKPKLTEERELLTATPSRSFFPRGFYWDEGFHLALIGEWDNDLRLGVSFSTCHWTDGGQVLRFCEIGLHWLTRMVGLLESRSWVRSPEAR